MVTAAAAVDPWWRALRWHVAGLLCLVTAINYVDRQALSVAAPEILREFGLSRTEYGWIVYGFLLAYACGQLLTGPVIDRLGTRRAFSLAVIAWSIAAMLHAFGRGFVSFLGLRALLGITESANFPAALKAVAEWFPAAERAMATGIITAGVGIGAILAPPLIGLLIHAFGWPYAFLLPGAVGLLWVWVWLRLYALPERHPTISPGERALILHGRSTSTERARRLPWRQLLRYRVVWGLVLARAVGDGAFYFFASWLPIYLAEARGFNILDIAMFAWIPFLAADIGSLSGGWLGGRLIRGGLSVDASRKIVIWTGALLVPTALLAVYVRSPYLAILLISASLFAIQVKSSSLFALPADLFAPCYVATVWGLSGAAGSLTAAHFQPLVGWLVDNFSYEPVFVIISSMHIVSAVFVMVLVKRVQPVTIDPDQ